MPKPVPLPLPAAVPAGIEAWRLAWDADEQPDLAGLTADEQARAARYLRPPDALPFALTRIALRARLAHVLGMEPLAVPLCVDARGKPAVNRPGAPAFSVSHVAGQAVIVLSAIGAVGVDIETGQPETVWRETAAVFLTPDEQRRCESLPLSRRAAAYAVRWSLKEAALKAAGIGIGDRLADLELYPDGEGWRMRPVRPWPFRLQDMRAVTLSLPPGLTGALAWFDPDSPGRTGLGE